MICAPPRPTAVVGLTRCLVLHNQKRWTITLVSLESDDHTLTVAEVL